MNDTTIPETSVIRDLGILVQNDVKFHDHINAIVRRANFCLRNIDICFKGFKIEFYVHMFVTYVRPLLESNTVVFSSLYIHDVNKIKRVQKRFTKFLPGLYNVSYIDRLKILNLESLEVRRIKCDIVNVFKSHRELVDMDFNRFFSLNCNHTRGHSVKIDKMYCRTNVNKMFWTHRVVDIWNSLPSSIVNSESVSTFKKLTDKMDFNGFCVGTVHRN